MTTTISVSEETREALKEAKRKGESYDAFLRRTALDDHSQLTSEDVRVIVRDELESQLRETLGNRR